MRRCGRGIDKVSFLTLDEKRAAVGYGPAPREEMEPPAPEAAFGGEAIPFVKYSPDQPRVPAGNSEGGQWTDGGGGGGSSSGRVRVAQAGAGATNDADEHERLIQLAQAEDAQGARVDLHEHEKRGGHTLAEHVGRSDSYLLARVRGERGPVLIRRRAGWFPSIEAATKLVNSTLARNRDIVARVARGELDDAFVTAEFDTQTGREAFAPSKTAEPFLRDTHGVGVLIVHDENETSGFTILSAYPRNPE